MNKEKFLRLYNRINIAFGVILLLFVILFIGQIPTVYAGVIEKNIFMIGIESISGIINIINAPLIVFISLFILNIYLLIRVKDTTVKNKYLQSVIFYNVVLLLMLIVGHLVFYFSIPDSINGEVVNNFIYLRFQVRSDEFINVVNVDYLLASIYLIYNIFVAFKSPEVKEKKFDEELYADQFYKDLENNE